MKAIKRKLLSLVLAMAMICSLMPTALASTSAVGLNVSAGLNQDGSITASATAKDGYTITGTEYTWSCSGLSNLGTTDSITVPAAQVTAGTTYNFSVSVAGTQTGNESITTLTGGDSVTVPDASTSITLGEISGTKSITYGGTTGNVTTLSVTANGTGADGSKVTWQATGANASYVEIGTPSPQGATSSVQVTAKAVTASTNVSIVATYDNNSSITAQTTVTVSPQTADKVVLSGTGVTAGANNTYTLTMNANTTATVTAQLKDTAGGNMSGVAFMEGGTAGVCSGSIDNNTITLNAGNVSTQGTGTFTVQCGGKTATLTVTVVPVTTITAALSAPDPSTISWNSNTTSSTSTTLTVTGDAAGYSLTWVISDGTALSVAASNNVTTLNGDYIISAKQVDSVKSVTIKARLTKTGATTIESNTITVTVNPYNTLVLSPTAGTDSTTGIVYLNNWTGNYDAEWRDFTVNATWYQGGVAQTIGSNSLRYSWTLNGNPLTNTSAYTNSYRLYSSTYGLKYGNQDNTLTCTVELYSGNSRLAYNTISWTIRTGYAGSALATASVARSTGSYALGDVDDAGRSSIVSQLDSYLSNKTGYYGLAYVYFTGATQNTTYGSLSVKTNTNTPYYADRRIATGASVNYLADVLFYPGSTTGSVSFPIRAYYYTSSTLNNTSWVDGSITFTVTEGVSTGDITYSAAIGSDVPFYQKDFEDFYYNKTKGTLSYVSFTLPSGGSLYADGGRLGSSNACYVSPTQTQTDLAGVYFSPTGTTATRANTVRVSFTASGNRSSVSGTVAITYLAGSAKDITYSVNTSSALKVSDFTDAYRQVVGSAAPTGLTIEFQSVPTYGTLSYKDSSRTNSSVVTLRSTNVKSYKFTTRTTGTNQIGDVTYTANGNHTDTIEYIAYVNNTPQFTGKVVFNATNTSASNMQVGFTSANGQAVAFSYTEFSKANPVVIASTSYIRFVTMPTGGTLTYNGTAMSLSSTNVMPTMLGNVIYRPNAGFNNSTDRISFLCYDANGNSVGGGQVSIVVTGNTSNGASSVTQFKDVPATAWYREDLSRLMSAGIIKGRGDGKFDPTAELTYGEALKIFMLASGYPAQAEASGKDWAINYKNLAVSNGWISGSVDLSAKISRNAMAELAAKSLGVAPVTTVPPVWTDGTSNSYSNALYYTNPQILIGNGDGTFNGTSTLKRQEICAIASRVLNYRSGQQSTDKPGWIG